MKRLVIVASLMLAAAASARDVVILANGESRAGEIAGFDGTTLRLRVPLPNSGVGAIPAGATATVSIPRADIEAIEFRDDPARNKLLREAGVEQMLEVELEWMRQRQWVAMPRSPAGAAGCKFGELLLVKGAPENVAKALEVFREVEGGAWSGADRMRAKQGRLRAMVASGNAAEAVGEARKIAEEFDDPVILIEANHIMAQATAGELEVFLKENPRWSEDTREIDDAGTRVIDQRHKLHKRALELFLYPALFYGSDNAKAARGLWGAVGIHRLGGDDAKAMEVARDIVALYPAAPEAKLAGAYLETLPPELLARDAAREAVEEMANAAGGSSPASKSNQPENP